MSIDNRYLPSVKQFALSHTTVSKIDIVSSICTPIHLLLGSCNVLMFSLCRRSHRCRRASAGVRASPERCTSTISGPEYCVPITFLISSSTGEWDDDPRLAPVYGFIPSLRCWKAVEGLQTHAGPLYPLNQYIKWKGSKA